MDYIKYLGELTGSKWWGVGDDDSRLFVRGKSVKYDITHMLRSEGIPYLYIGNTTIIEVQISDIKSSIRDKKINSIFK